MIQPIFSSHETTGTEGPVGTAVGADAHAALSKTLPNAQRERQSPNHEPRREREPEHEARREKPEV